MDAAALTARVNERVDAWPATLDDRITPAEEAFDGHRH